MVELDIKGSVGGAFRRSKDGAEVTDEGACGFFCCECLAGGPGGTDPFEDEAAEGAGCFFFPRFLCGAFGAVGTVFDAFGFL